MPDIDDDQSSPVLSAPPPSCQWFAIALIASMTLHKSFVPTLIASALCLPVCGFAQTFRPLARPPEMLPPQPTQELCYDASFDAFETPVSGNVQTGLWQTIGVPFGSWASPAHWSQQTLASTTISRIRQKFVQRVNIESGWIYKNGDQGLGDTFLGAGIAMAVPLGSINNVVLVAPRFQVDWLDGPSFIDVPPQLYSTSIDIGWRLVINDRLSTIVGLRPGWYVDRSTPQDGFRLSGLAVVNYELLPKELTVVAGVAYLDRNDYSWLPAVGLSWYPSPDLRYDLTFPKPKIARRVGHIPYLSEDWVYVAGSIGGNTWSVLRQSGQADELTLSDYRISLGIERVVNGGGGFNVELGYVFHRRLEYQVNPIDLSFGDSFIIQGGLTF